MREFADLYDRLDSTTSTNAMVEALVEYFESAHPADAAWAIHFLCGRRDRRPVTTTQLRRWTYELGDLPEWLFEECYIKVGDLAETISLCLDDGSGVDDRHDVALRAWGDERLPELRRMSEARQRATVTEWWQGLDRRGIFMLNKLMMGAMRVGVSSGLVERALAEMTGLDRPTVAHRLMGDWEPSAAFFERLVAEDTTDADRSRPYPYFLASPLDEGPDELGPVDDWMVEWKWDGIRAQIVKRGGEVFIWSRGEELITDTYPELRDAAKLVDGSAVLDGEIVAWRDGQPLPFERLQERIGRQAPGPGIRREVPVVFKAYDLLERAGEDTREMPVEARRYLLETLLEGAPDPMRLSQLVDAGDWDDYAGLRDGARERHVEGLMLKRVGSPYRAGRRRGDWWKWKVDPLTIDAVLVYAKAGHGWRADLYTDLTFAVWDDDELVPIAKAYSGLDDDQIEELDDWVKSNTLERYGPVRSVEAEHVFEIHFAGISPSNRHKSGIALRFPRIGRWRRDLGVDDADTLEYAERLLERHYPGETDQQPEQQQLFAGGGA